MDKGRKELEVTWNGRKVEVEYIKPPIPLNDFDWEATLQDWDLGDKVGHGPTRNQAVANLLQQLVDDVMDEHWMEGR